MYRTDRSQVTSEKYVIKGTKTVRPEFAGDNRDQRSFGYWCSLWLGECQRIAKPGAPICISSDWRQLATVTDVLQAGGFVWRGIIPWDKTEMCRKTLGRFSTQAEYVVWGSNGPMPYDRDVGCLPGVMRVAVDPHDKHHMTGKPLELMLQLIKICEPGGLIVDPFCGSATTGVAAIRRGYRFLGIEREIAYVQTSRERLTAEGHEQSLQDRQAGQVPLFGENAS